VGNCRLDLRFIREDAIPGDVLDLPYSETALLYNSYPMEQGLYAMLSSSLESWF